MPHPGHSKSFPGFSAVKGKPDFAHADSVARLANHSTVEAMQLTNLIENEEKRVTFSILFYRLDVRLSLKYPMAEQKTFGRLI